MIAIGKRIAAERLTCYKTAAAVHMAMVQFDLQHTVTLRSWTTLTSIPPRYCIGALDPIAPVVEIGRKLWLRCASCIALYSQLFSTGYPVPLTYQWIHAHRALQFCKDTWNICQA